MFLYNLGLIAQAAGTNVAAKAAEAVGTTNKGIFGGQAGGSPMTMIILLGMLVVFYLILFIPEMRRRKKLKKQREGMKKGDKIVTSGGLVGTIEFVGDKTVYVKSQDAKFEIAKDFVASIINPTDETDKK